MDFDTDKSWRPVHRHQHIHHAVWDYGIHPGEDHCSLSPRVTVPEHDLQESKPVRGHSNSKQMKCKCFLLVHLWIEKKLFTYTTSNMTDYINILLYRYRDCAIVYLYLIAWFTMAKHFTNSGLNHSFISSNRIRDWYFLLAIQIKPLETYTCRSI